MKWNNDSKENYLDFLNQKKDILFLIAPFIKKQALEEVLGNVEIKNLKVITSWNPSSILIGFSDKIAS